MDDGAGFSARRIFQSALQQQQQPRRTVDVGALDARVVRVSIAGASRIRPAVLDRLSHRVMMASTVGEIAQEAREAGGRLQALGIAKEARVVMDQATEPESAGGGGQQGVAVDVGLECTDGPRYSVKTEAGVDDAEGTAGVAARMLNVFGGGETADIHYSRGTRTQAAFQGVFAAPVDADPHRLLSIAVSQRLTSRRPYSSHDEALRELGVAYRAADPARPASHELAYSLAWRNLCSLGADASPTLRAEAGHSLKSSAWHTVAIDTRDSARVPTRGSLLRLTSEAAGLADSLGDARFVKARAELQANQTLGAGFVVSTGLQAGILWNLDSRASRLPDRFFLGGAASVRGFELHGIGPRDANDSVGGDVFYAAGVSLLTPLPLVATPALRGHVWANAGQLALLDSRGLLRNTSSHSALASPAAPEVRRFLMSPSAAVGVGLVYNHPVVRAELSLCFPIAATPTDRPKPGLQFGLGLAFL
ncbi:hypothetical protein IWW48_000992 [Coemansia sp. RSA 1200]|nr:hypothetical protein IWW48_000992 [Coemansia sp. RSA 1200]